MLQSQSSSKRQIKALAIIAILVGAAGAQLLPCINPLPSSIRADDSAKALPQQTIDDAHSAAGYGTVVGQILLDGEPPVIVPLVKKDQDRKDAALCMGEIPNESLLINSKTRGIRNVFVYLTRAPAIHPDLLKSTVTEIKINTDNCRYAPHALVTRTDQEVLVELNGHTLHPVPSRNPSFGLALSADRIARFRYRQPERHPFKFVCDVHPWMSGYWLILDHPYAALSDEAGKFRIEKLPAGNQKFVIWHEESKHLEKELAVTIKSDETTDLGTLRYPLEKFRPTR